jgi:hypothetical protein
MDSKKVFVCSWEELKVGRLCLPHEAGFYHRHQQRRQSDGKSFSTQTAVPTLSLGDKANIENLGRGRKRDGWERTEEMIDENRSL